MVPMCTTEKKKKAVAVCLRREQRNVRIPAREPTQGKAQPQGSPPTREVIHRGAHPHGCP